MNNQRKTVRLAGILYILGTVAGFGAIIAKPYFDAPDHLIKVSGNAAPILLGTLSLLTMAMMSVLLYPVLKHYNQTLAIGYTICRLLSVALGQAVVNDSAGLPALQAIGTALTDPRAGNAITTIFFISGALMFYSLLYRSRLVPRWISMWGLVAALPYLASSLLILFGAAGSGSTTESILILPLFVQEVVLAVWMIVKGFSAKDEMMRDSE
jgi:hypothetical protein